IGWFAAVFQAVIGTPLLLLGHITVKKGSMILGPDRGKYMMILEIFLRPVLMVFGMIGSMLLLSVATYIFNDLYNFAWGVRSMNSVWGGSILSFASYFKGLAYISIYVTTIYTIATNCFKLIDDVPGKVISWMGGGAGYSLSGAENAVEQGAGSAGKFIEKSIDASRQKSLEDEQTNKKKNIARDDRIKDTIVKHGSEKGNMLADMEEGKWDANKGEYVDMSDQEKKEAKQRLEDHRSGGDPYGIRAKENASTSSTGLNQDGNMNIEPPKKDS
ncbi:MAG: hypothetical protein N4A43_03710, partial [Alphaproteobacteria bacterium]|nr:hypothetical protein [Alphaproteobacteria bacterium]